MFLLRLVGQAYFLLLPIIIGGVLNMVFVKLPLLQSWRVPMDGGKTLRDGKRLFGDHKTWKGFVGMIVLTALAAWLVWHRSFELSWLRGALVGFAYVLAELPNSFVKRRLNLPPGKSGGFVQTFFDQADSIIGCLLFMLPVIPINAALALAYLVLGTATHYLINVLLYLIKLRGQKG